MLGPHLIKRMGIGLVVGLVVAFVVSIFAPRIYEARTELVLMDSGPRKGATAPSS